MVQAHVLSNWLIFTIHLTLAIGLVSIFKSRVGKQGLMVDLALWTILTRVLPSLMRFAVPQVDAGMDRRNPYNFTPQRVRINRIS